MDPLSSYLNSSTSGKDLDIELKLPENEEKKLSYEEIHKLQVLFGDKEKID